MSDICEQVSCQTLKPSHYQLSIISLWIWLVITFHLLKIISEGVQRLSDYQTLKLVTEVDWWLFVIELVIFLKVSGIVPITDSQICHISVDCWILVIELVIFLKESGVGPITNSQICNIDVDCWILVMELVKSLKMSEVGPITNSQICHI